LARSKHNGRKTLRSNPPRTARFNYLVDVVCDNGQTFDAIWAAVDGGIVGHDLEGNQVGVATALWIADAGGNRLAPVWERPGRGLAAITSWCWFPAPLSPTGYAGTDVIFSANDR
jgi:hypothetical protein